MNPLERERVAAALARLVKRDCCVLTYDRNLIEALPDIVVEQYRIRSDAEIVHCAELRSLFEALKPGSSNMWHINELPSLIRVSGIDLSMYDCRAAGTKLQSVAREFDHWTPDTAEVKLGGVLQLQADLGMGRHNSSMQRYDSQRGVASLRDYLRSVTSAPPSLIERVTRRSFWERKILAWKRARLISADAPSLSVGPRWVTEIEFFRDVLGLRRHIGLDLFSDNPDLVVAGDMHAMPFENGHFQLVFLKNVVDKSYDVRKLVAELMRVTRPRGIVVVDQVCGYGECTPITRTDIQRAENFAKLFAARGPTEVLVDQDIDISGIGDAAASGAKRINARLAIRIG
jgi:SAM-dependent methyltransferase